MYIALQIIKKIQVEENAPCIFGQQTVSFHPIFMPNADGVHTTVRAVPKSAVTLQRMTSAYASV